MPQTFTQQQLFMQQRGIQLSEDDLKQVAIAAESINGFSFENLWFKGLDLLS